MIGSQQTLLAVEKKKSAMKGPNTCTPLFSINRHYITSNKALLNKYKLKFANRSIVFIEIVTKYDLNGFKIDSCFINKNLDQKILLKLQMPNNKTNTKYRTFRSCKNIFIGNGSRVEVTKKGDCSKTKDLGVSKSHATMDIVTPFFNQRKHINR